MASETGTSSSSPEQPPGRTVPTRGGRPGSYEGLLGSPRFRGSRRRLGRLLAVWALFAASAACREPPPSEPPIPDSTYVQVMTELALLRQRVEAGRDTSASARASADSLRRTILGAHRVTEEELLSFAAVRGSQPEEMRRLWEEIAARVDSLSRHGPPPSELPPPWPGREAGSPNDRRMEEDRAGDTVEKGAERRR